MPRHILVSVGFGLGLFIFTKMSILEDKPPKVLFLPISSGLSFQLAAVLQKGTPGYGRCMVTLLLDLATGAGKRTAD